VPRGVGYTSAANLYPLFGGHDHVNHLDLGDLIEDFPWLMPQTCRLAHLPDGLPQDIGQKADQDVRLGPLSLLVPDGAHALVSFLYPKGSLSLG